MPVIVTCYFCKKQANLDEVSETWIPNFITTEGKISDLPCCENCLDRVKISEDEDDDADFYEIG